MINKSKIYSRLCLGVIAASLLNSSQAEATNFNLGDKVVKLVVGLTNFLPEGSELMESKIKASTGKYDKGVLDLPASCIDESTGKYAVAVAKNIDGTKAEVTLHVSSADNFDDSSISLGFASWGERGAKDQVAVTPYKADWSVSGWRVGVAKINDSERLEVELVDVSKKTPIKKAVENLSNIKKASKVKAVQVGRGSIQIIVEITNTQGTKEIRALGIKGDKQIYDKLVATKATLVDACVKNPAKKTAVVVYEADKKVKASYQTKEGGAYNTTKTLSRVGDVVVADSSLASCNENYDVAITYKNSADEVVAITDSLGDTPDEKVVTTSSDLGGVLGIVVDSMNNAIISLNDGDFNKTYSYKNGSKEYKLKRINSLETGFGGAQKAFPKANNNPSLSGALGFLNLDVNKFSKDKFQVEFDSLTPDGDSSADPLSISGTLPKKMKSVDYSGLRVVACDLKGDAAGVGAVIPYTDEEGKKKETFAMFSSGRGYKAIFLALKKIIGSI